MYDCDDMSRYAARLEAAGISKKDFDITRYAGLTARELQVITDSVIKTYGKETK